MAKRDGIKPIQRCFQCSWRQYRGPKWVERCPHCDGMMIVDFFHPVGIRTSRWLPGGRSKRRGGIRKAD